MPMGMNRICLSLFWLKWSVPHAYGDEPNSRYGSFI